MEQHHSRAIHTRPWFSPLSVCHWLCQCRRRPQVRHASSSKPPAIAAATLVVALFVTIVAVADSRAETPPAAPPRATPPPIVTKPPAVAVPAAASTFQELHDVVYIRRDGEDLKGDAYVPAGKGPFPAVLVVHGGAWRGGDKRMGAAHARQLAARGYSVLAINYRLAPKYKFPAQLDDCRDAVRYMRREAAKYKIDPSRIAGCGYSAGGHLVCLLGTEHDAKEHDAKEAGVQPPLVSAQLQAVVAGGAPCDFRMIPENDQMLSFWLGGTRHEKPNLYAAASPLAFVAADDPPMFLYHGDVDSLVPINSPKRMVEQLREKKVPAEFYVVPGEGHIGAFLNPKAFDAAVAFLDKQLKPPAPASTK